MNRIELRKGKNGDKRRVEKEKGRKYGLTTDTLAKEGWSPFLQKNYKQQPNRI